VRLPGEASPAKEAQDGQHKNDDDDDPKNRHVILSLGACRLYGDPTRICKVRGLRREWYGSRSGESRGERGEDAEVGVECHALDAEDGGAVEHERSGLVDLNERVS